MKKVLITDALAPRARQVLMDAGLEVIEILDGDTEKLRMALAVVDGWIIRSGTTIREAEMQQAPRLKAIGRAGVGVDNIDVNTASSRGIVVMNTPGGNTISAAEHTIALMLALARNIPAGDSSLKAGTWNRKALVGTELNGKSLGILGLGRIGQEVARRAIGLQMKIIGYDPYVSQDQLLVKDIEVLDLEAVIEQSDVLSLHLPRNEDTLNLISMSELKRMKSSGLLINCARGGLVNEADLATALEEEIIAGAAVDVYTVEPPLGNPLMGAKNIVLTPHLGASTLEAAENVAEQIATQMKDYLLHDHLVNTINLPIKDMSILKAISTTLDLSRVLGGIQQSLHSGAIKSLRLSYNGETEHLQPLLYAAFEGLMAYRHDGVINMINAQSVASSKGISLSILSDPELSQVQNVVAIRVESSSGKVWELMGYTDVQGGQRLTMINNYRVDILLDGPLILILNVDIPGVVGEVGTLLGEAGINIAEYSLCRQSGGSPALSLIKCDSIPAASLLTQLKSVNSIEECYFLS